MLQVSSSESDWLREQAAARAESTFVAQVNRTVAQAFNVTAKIAGSNPALAPLVLMAPRSGWWQCASEQGSRLATRFFGNRSVYQTTSRPDKACIRVDFFWL